MKFSLKPYQKLFWGAYERMQQKPIKQPRKEEMTRLSSDLCPGCGAKGYKSSWSVEHKLDCEYLPF